MKQIIASWSGGKDSCFACYKALQSGLEVSYILNSISKKFKRSSFHGVREKLLELQSENIGIPLCKNWVTAKSYENSFKALIRKLKPRGVIFGDIDLQEHRDWIERVCREIGVKPYMPLWGSDQEKLLIEFVEAGFKAIVVAANAKIFGKEWLGRKVDKKFLADLKKLPVTPCGELGEYHTFVIDGPLFRKPVEISYGKTVLRRGYWFLDLEPCLPACRSGRVTT
ncbi:MAG: hypothetical protein FD145_350 [Candidatus Saganbacteria bacterium]|uniref:Diphthamide synthase domain-containing protein n=1 Tax=Candidatus Saganbacteria bacterium TaxID=2575572 RepID=A0A833L251_UNCSA|nr:MAG: hypothetical protein FD145_350 [Candidatus Saganbacteria bacterium]